MSSMKVLQAPGDGKDAAVVSKDVPKIKQNEILVQTKAAALNPTDWKHMRRQSPKGASLGCDFSGVVTEIGSDVKDVKVGDRVASCVYGSMYPDIGAFAEQLKADSALVWKVPDNCSFEEAAAIGGVGCETAVFALYHALKLPKPGQSKTNEPFLIYSGATSVGQYAIQLAKASGLKVATTASRENHAYLKDLGADACFDYKDPDCAKKVKEWAGETPITSGLDCISEKGSTKTAADCMESGTIVTLLPVDAEKEGIKNVTVTPMVLYTSFGQDFTFYGKLFPANAEHKEFRSKFAKEYMTDLISSGQLKANPIKKLEGGLESILEGMKYMEEGKAKRQKLVYSFKQ